MSRTDPREEQPRTYAFEVWRFPGGLVWEGPDQEEAILTGLKIRQPGLLIEVVEATFEAGQMTHLRRLAKYDGTCNCANCEPGCECQCHETAPQAKHVTAEDGDVWCPHIMAWNGHRSNKRPRMCPTCGRGLT